MALPTGIITIWHGAIVDIPVGWTLCDGTNGTPDLRDRFIVGAGNTYAVGATGGLSNHTHTFTTDGHQHTLLTANVLQGGATLSDTTTIDTDSGTTDQASLLPPYYALAYIMKT